MAYIRRSIKIVPRCARLYSGMSDFSGSCVQFDPKGETLILRLDNKKQKMNVLNKDFRIEMQECIHEFRNSSSLKSAVVISSKPASFVAGADLEYVKKAMVEGSLTSFIENYHKLNHEMETIGKPVVAAVHGLALGGGCELMLPCTYRVATDFAGTLFGFPEVLLGLLPGGNGTINLPGLIGLPKAVEMLLSGKTVNAKKAKSIGLVDQLVDPLVGPEADTRRYLEEVAINCAKKLADGTLKRTPKKHDFQTSAIGSLIGMKLFRNYFFDKMIKPGVMKQTKGLYPAPLAIIEVLREQAANGREAGRIKELNEFIRLAHTKESSALIGLLNGQTYCKKKRFGKPEVKVNNLSILGAGLMGAGVAQVSINKQFNTTLKDDAEGGLKRGYQQVFDGFDKLAKKKKISTDQRDAIMNKLHTTVSYGDLSNADMVIDTLVEDLNTKQQAVKLTDAVTPEHCVFATHTSLLPVTEIAKASTRPEKVIGMHYFSPVDKMQLLEIIKTDETSQDTIASAVEVGLRQGKLVIVVKDSPGFYTTRTLSVMLNEAVRMLQEGIPPKKLDKISSTIGLPGVATLLDQVGIDVVGHVANYLQSALGERLSGGNAKVLASMVEAGFMGRKNGKGIFMYEGKSKDRTVNEEALEIFQKYKLPSTEFASDSDIQMRLISRFVNEAVLSFQEGILQSPFEGDIAATFGLDFPKQLGGPFRYLDVFGAEHLVKNMQRFEQAYGSSFTPCQLLLDHAKDNSKKFYN